jgi:hypothetical protein
VFERCGEIRLALDTHYVAADTRGLERFLNKLCVARIVFKMQNTQLRLH